MSSPLEVGEPHVEWSIGQVLQWLEEFRQMMYAVHAEPGLDSAQIYDKIRNADPSRRAQVEHDA